MRTQAPLLLAALSFAGLGAQAQILTTEHVDVGLDYVGSAWDLHVHDDTHKIKYTPAEATLVVGLAAMTLTPPVLSAFNTAGAPLWILPKTQDPSLLFLGFGAEELTPADWTGNISLSLKSVSGPGDFGVYDVGAFGDIQAKFNSRDGINGTDTLTVIPGSHAHYNWTFTAPGTYQVGFEATGTHLVDGLVSSGTVEYNFVVVPEPETVALGTGFALAAFGLWRRTRQSTR